MSKWMSSNNIFMNSLRILCIVFWLYLPPYNSSQIDSSTPSLYPSNFQSSSSLSTFLFFSINPLSAICVAHLLLRVGPAWSVFSFPGITPRDFMLTLVPPSWGFLWLKLVQFLCMCHNCCEFLYASLLLHSESSFLEVLYHLWTFLSPLLLWSLSLSRRGMICMFYLSLNIPQFLILCSSTSWGYLC